MTGASFWSQFELRQLRCFVAAAEELHFGRAAARMNMTQPPLSRQIQLLEHVLGVRLLDRTSRAVKLTPAGRVFLLEARRILRLTESAALATRRIASGEAGTITLGFTAASGYSFLPRLLLQRASHAPNIDVALKEMVSGEQMESLLTGRIDVGLLRPPIDRSEFTTRRVVRERLVVALPFGDDRLAEAALSLKDFDRRPLVMYAADGARYFHDMLTGLFDAAAVKPVNVQSLSQIHSMLALVRAGIGAALVPEAAQSLHFDDVQFRPVTTEPTAPVELYAAWRSDNDNPALAAFLDLLRQDETDSAAAHD
ncbi:MAG TPA: LysR substrate-binding domain-containing protein [Rhizomicrobium sp.]